MSAFCGCFPCRRSGGLRTIAPRLARAHDQNVAAARARVEHRRYLTGQLLKAEKLLAHRDLHYLRALHERRSGKYLARRRQKLDWARNEVERLRAQLEEHDHHPQEAIAA